MLDRLRRLCIDQFEHLIQPLDLRFGFAVVFLECGAEVLILSGLGHLRQCGQDFLLRVVDVLQRIVEQFVKLLGLFCHVHVSRVSDATTSHGARVRSLKTSAWEKRCGARRRLLI
jgi:hypothetical protein